MACPALSVPLCVLPPPHRQTPRASVVPPPHLQAPRASLLRPSLNFRSPLSFERLWTSDRVSSTAPRTGHRFIGPLPFPSPSLFGVKCHPPPKPTWKGARTYASARSLAGRVATERKLEAECDADDVFRVPFDLNLAVLLAGFAFETYNDPTVTPETPQETDSAGCTATYLSSQFVSEQFSGQLRVKMVCATNCPAMDLWGTSDPYAVVQVGGGSARTRTAWTTKEPVWKEDLSLLIQVKQDDASTSIEKEYLRVSLWDAGILVAPRRMGSASISLSGLCDGNAHQCSLTMEGPGGGAKVYFEVQYKSFEQIAEEQKNRWQFPSASKLLEAAALPEQIISSLLPFLSSSSSSPALSTSDFVRSALQAFDSPFPLSVDSIKASSLSDPSLLSPTQTEGENARNQSEGTLVQKQEQTPAVDNSSEARNSDRSSATIFDAAMSVLSSAGWLPSPSPPERPTEEVTKGAESPSPPPPESGSVASGSIKWGGIDLSALAPSREKEKRRQDLEKELLDSGLVLADDDSVGGDKDKVSTGEKTGVDAGAGVPGVSSYGGLDLEKAVFSQTEGLLGWLALLGAANGAKEETKDLKSNAIGMGGGAEGNKLAVLGADVGAAEGAMEGGVEGGDKGGVEGGEEMTEDQKQAMKDVFGRAETAVEAWTILASSLGQQTFVKSEFEKIAFLDNTNSDTQLALWRDLEGRRLVVAFRGTEQTKLKDLLTDISLAPAGLNPERTGGGSFETETMVHSGFLNAYDSVRSRLISLLRDVTDPSRDAKDPLRDNGFIKPWHLLITGHSLGGALATLLAKELSTARFIQERAIELTMYNYGSPRVGNGVFANEYNAKMKDSWRVVNHRDIVPTVPRLMGYRHVCCPVYLNPLPPAMPTAKEAEASAARGVTAQEEDGYLGDVIGEKTTTDIVSEVLEGGENIFDRLLQTEIAMLQALRDGSAISMHMEDFYYVALLKKVKGNLQRDA